MNLRVLWFILGLVVMSASASGSHADNAGTTASIQALPNQALLDVVIGERISCPPPQSAAECSGVAEQELIRRAPVEELARTALNGHFPRDVWATLILEKIDRSEAERELRQLAERPPERVSYEAQMHFARRCETWALARLNQNWWTYGIPSAEWAAAVEQFGSCHYEDATSGLTDALKAASLNVVDAACRSLKVMYPAGPDCANFESPADAQSAWRTWLSRR